jgi:hypothetical protein
MKSLRESRFSSAERSIAASTRAQYSSGEHPGNHVPVALVDANRHPPLAAREQAKRSWLERWV